jgi:hypothetical protein
MQWWMNVGIGAAVLLSCSTGCNMQFRPRGYRPTPLPQATPVPVAAGQLAVSGRPAYRLIVTPLLADAPSRLLVVQVRINSGDDRALTLASEDISVVLPTGEVRPAFDRGRALELLRRTSLAEADLSYLRNGAYVPGGVDSSILPQLNALVVSQLLPEGAFTGGYVVQGYVVVDTGVALPSLNGSSLQAVAYRLSDGVPAQGFYQFAAAGGSATPTYTPPPDTPAATAEPVPAVPAAEAAVPQPAPTYEVAPVPTEPTPPAPAPVEQPPAQVDSAPVGAEQVPAEQVAPSDAAPGAAPAGSIPADSAPADAVPVDSAPAEAPIPAPVEEAPAFEPETNPPTPRGTR